MSPEDDDRDSVVLALRREFDDAFTREVEPRDEATVDFIVARFGEVRRAIRAESLISLATAERLEPMPSHDRSFLGLVSARGKLVPVFSLAALVGAGEADASRWLIFVGREEPFALAFDQLDGYLRVHQQAIASSATEDHASHLRGVVLDARGAVPILDPESIARELRGRRR